MTDSSAIKGISFNLWDKNKWEFVLKTPPEPQRKTANKSKSAAWEDEESDEDDFGGDASNDTIPMPPPWPNAIVITREEFETRLPAGGKTVLFRNVQLVCMLRQIYSFTSNGVKHLV